MIYFTGDIHGSIAELKRRFANIQTTDDDTIVILGDAGFNYYLDERDRIMKENKLLFTPAKILCIHGNHECRPENIPTYQTRMFCGGVVHYEPSHPKILFADDGQRYKFKLNGKEISALVIGGAYSVDKYYRLQRGWNWFEDELPTQRTKDVILRSVERDPGVDLVLTHTCPLEWQPTHLFLPSIDQSTVDTSMEEFLSEVERKLMYKYWLFAHFHGDEFINRKARMLYKDVISIEEVLYDRNKPAV